MNNKYYTLGLGSGIIICALIMYIALLLTDVNNENVDMSDEYVVSRAVELGMIFPDEIIMEYDSENDLQSEEVELDVELELELELELDESYDSELTRNVEEMNTSSAEIHLTQNIDNGFVTFTVPAGSSSYAVSKTLYENDLIDNEDSFNQYLINNNINTKIRTGTFKIKKGSSYSDIAGYLTGQ